jgi:hypothetical protein
MATVQTFSQLEKVIGGKNHARGSGLLLDMMGTYRTEEICKGTLMDLYPNEPAKFYSFVDKDNINQDAIAIEKRMIEMMDPGCGRNPQNDKIMDYLQRQFIYSDGRAYVYYSEGLGYMANIIQQTQALGDTTLSLDDIAVGVMVQSDSRKAAQPGYVDSFCLDKSISGQKRADAVAFIQFVTSTKEAVRQLAPPGGVVRYLSLACLSVYEDADLIKVAFLYPQLLPVMKLVRYFPPPADWDWAPGLEAKPEQILPNN